MSRLEPMARWLQRRMVFMCRYEYSDITEGNANCSEENALARKTWVAKNKGTMEFCRRIPGIQDDGGGQQTGNESGGAGQSRDESGGAEQSTNENGVLSSRRMRMEVLSSRRMRMEMPDNQRKSLLLLDSHQRTMELAMEARNSQERKTNRTNNR